MIEYVSVAISLLVLGLLFAKSYYDYRTMKIRKELAKVMMEDRELRNIINRIAHEAVLREISKVCRYNNMTVVKYKYLAITLAFILVIIILVNNLELP